MKNSSNQTNVDIEWMEAGGVYFNLYSISASGVRLEFYVMNIAPPAVQLPSISISTRSNDIEPFQHISVLVGLRSLPPFYGWIFSLIRELGGWQNKEVLGKFHGGPVWSTLIGRGSTRLVSHWSRWLIVLLRQCLLCHKEPADARSWFSMA